MVRINERTSAGRAGRPVPWRLFHVHHNLKPRRCQAMTVSGLTMTSAARQSVHTRESTTQSQRSIVASLNRRRRLRCITCSWWRNARTSSWSAARECAHVRRVRRTDSGTDIITRSVSIGCRNINRINKNDLFSSDNQDFGVSQPFRERVEILGAVVPDGDVVACELLETGKRAQRVVIVVEDRNSHSWLLGTL
jgi:hypothetical protein